MKSFNVSNAVRDPNLLEQATFARIPTKEETKSKIKLEQWQAMKKHILDIAISVFALASTSYFIYYCFAVLNNSLASADDKKWAMSLITLITSGVVGYLVGKVSPHSAQ